MPKNPYELYKYGFGAWWFDVNTAWRLVERRAAAGTMHPRRVSMETISPFIDQNIVRINDHTVDPPVVRIHGHDEAMRAEVDPDVPLLLAHFSVGGEANSGMLLDGWHRAYKAREQGLDALPAYELPTDDLLRCISPCLMGEVKKAELRYHGRRDADGHLCGKRLAICTGVFKLNAGLKRTDQWLAEEVVDLVPDDDDPERPVRHIRHLVPLDATCPACGQYVEADHLLTPEKFHRLREKEQEKITA